MALQEYYNTGDDGAYFIKTTYRPGQTFTTQSAYTIGSVKVLLYRDEGTSPGTITCDLYSTSAGLPTGAALATGTFNGNTLPEGAGNAIWQEISFTVPYALSTATMYAIALYSGDGATAAWWRYDGSSPTYTGGTFVYYFGGWTANSGRDNMFELYSYESATYVDASVSIETEVDVLVSAETVAYVDAAVAISAEFDIDISAYLKTEVTGTSLISNKRIIAVGNDQLWYEDI